MRIAEGGRKNEEGRRRNEERRWKKGEWGEGTVTPLGLMRLLKVAG
jgi:hypothetical protein